MTQNDYITSKSKQEIMELLLGNDSKELGLNDIIQIQEKFADPLILSVIMHQLLSERKKTNQILIDMQEKYESLSTLLKEKEEKKNEGYNILPEVDDKIISYIREKGKVDAESVQEHFNYKGTNAASQRLNKLTRDNYLTKIQAGRKVYFIVK
ncbi:MAG: hypothetical protein WCF78_04190 [archaeon]